MLRQFISALLISMMVLLSGVVAQASNFGHGDIREISDNRPVPWPWNLAAPFPWRDIQGLWKVQQGEYVSYFALKIVKVKDSGERQLQVKQIDGLRCRVIATGVGFERKQIVRAQMTDEKGKAYRVSLTAFNVEDSPEVPLQGKIHTNSVMVLSINSLEVQAAEPVHMQLTKVSATLNMKHCMAEVKK